MSSLREAIWNKMQPWNNKEGTDAILNQTMKSFIVHASVWSTWNNGLDFRRRVIIFHCFRATACIIPCVYSISLEFDRLSRYKGMQKWSLRALVIFSALIFFGCERIFLPFFWLYGENLMNIGRKCKNRLSKKLRIRRVCRSISKMPFLSHTIHTLCHYLFREIRQYHDFGKSAKESGNGGIR